MRNILQYGFALLAFMQATLFVSCTEQNNNSGDKNPITEEGVLAVVGTARLTFDEVLPLLPPKMHGEDSINFLKNAVHSWVKERLLYNYALEQKAVDEEAMNLKLEEFKKEWVIHQFEDKFYTNTADTGYTEDEIQAYYRLHKQDFLLTETLWKGLFVSLHKGSRAAEKAEKQLNKGGEKALNELKAICSKNSFDYHLNPGQWVPLKLINEKNNHWATLSHIVTGRLYKTEDEDYIYFWKPEYVLNPGDPAPYSFLRERIITILTHKNRIKAIEELQEKLYNESLKKNEVEIATI